MRSTLPILLALVWAIRPEALGQHSGHNQEQTNFGAEDPFQKPLSLSADAVQSLRVFRDTGDLLKDCAEQEGIPAAEIPASWFVASEIQLGPKSPASLVVRGERACLGGAHIAQFWVLAKTAETYTVVFQGRGDGLAVLPARTNGYRDIQLVIVTQAGANIGYVKFRYSKGAYHVSGHRIEHQ